MIDSSGQVTASYAYGDYGQPIGANPALLPTPAASPAGNAAVNPFGYDGAYTNPATGTEYLPARTYDPGQGRFLSLDAADQINRYQAFATNPINNTDPTGQWAFPQILTDAFAAALFLACGVLSGAASVPVLAAVLAGEETAATAITASVVFNAFSAATNIGAAATSATLAANDAAELTGNGFLSDDSKEKLNTANTILGTIATATGVGAGVADSFKEEATALTADASAGASASTASPPPNYLSQADADSLDAGIAQLQGQYSQLAAVTDQFGDLALAEGDLPEAATDPGAANSLAAPSAAPQGPDPAAPQVTAVQQQAGQDASLNPIVQPFAQADAVPANPANISPGNGGRSPSTGRRRQQPRPRHQPARRGCHHRHSERPGRQHR